MEAEATYDYEAMEDDELTLKVGDVITDIKQKDDGWCEGVLRGRRGVFPDNFVKFRQLKAFLPPEIPKAVLPSDLPKAVIPEMRGMESKVKVRRAKVAYSYTAENPDELNLTPGQVVEVIAEEEAGWWKGSVGGKVGVFPSNFVEELADDVRPEPPRTDSKITPEPVKLPPVDTAKLPINTVPLPVNESKPPIAPQDTRTDETDSM